MQGKRTANRRAAALRQALMLSISSMLVCAMMLVGMTYAWFTDSAVTAVNAIHTGTLNVDLMYSNKPIQQGNANAQRLYSNSKLFTKYTRWEPNNFEVVYLAVVNNGSIPVRYSLALNNISATRNVANENAENSLLQDFQYAIVPLTDSDSVIDEATLLSYYKSSLHPISDISGGMQSSTLTAVPDSTSSKPTQYYALILYYKDISLTSDQTGTVTLGLRLLAIQQNNTAGYTTKSDDSSQGGIRNPWNEAADSKYSNLGSESTTPETSNSSETSEN